MRPTTIETISFPRRRDLHRSGTIARHTKQNITVSPGRATIREPLGVNRPYRELSRTISVPGTAPRRSVTAKLCVLTRGRDHTTLSRASLSGLVDVRRAASSGVGDLSGLDRDPTWSSGRHIPAECCGWPATEARETAKGETGPGRRGVGSARRVRGRARAGTCVISLSLSLSLSLQL